MSETPARDGMLDFALAAFKDSPNPVVAAHANKLADAFEAEARAAVPSAPADRGAEIRAHAFKTAALYVRGHSADKRFDKCSVSTALCTVSDELRRMADEAQQPTPCSQPNPCEDGGDPCTTHEREQAHAEGDHGLCGADPCSGCRYVPCGNCQPAAVSQPGKEA